MEEGYFGAEIALLRKKKGMSIRELARKILKEDGEPMSASYLCDIEKGRKKPPSLEVIRRMAEKLDADFDNLLNLARRTPPDIKQYLQDNPEARKMLRKAKQLGFGDWKEVEEYIENLSKGPPNAHRK